MPFVPTSHYLDNYFSEESHFCQLYSLPIQQLDKDHWSPLLVAKRATEFLVNEPDAKILDIGSGAGKFCFAGAYYEPSAFFYGVEQHQYLVDCAGIVKAKLGRLKIEFIHRNFTQINFKEYDNFYFYNSFAENLDGATIIDNTIDYSVELYDYYNRFLNYKLDEIPAGTRLVTFKSPGLEIAPSYSLAAVEMDNQLKFWIKK